MPRLVADFNSGALSAMVCVGLRQDSRRVEWELLPVAMAQSTLIATFGMHALTHKTERGRQDRLFLPPLFPSFEKGVVRSLAAKQNASWVKWRGRIFESDDSEFDFLHAALIPAIESLASNITSERHNFGASAPEPNPQKTGAAHSSVTGSEAAAAFNLNGQSLG